MKPLRLSVRFPVTEVPEDLEPAIRTFHRFIQYGYVEGFIIDVADYRHVPQGPGVLLVGHDVDYGVSPDAFTVVRKRNGDQAAGTQLRDALRMGLGALEAITFDDEFEVAADRSRFTVAVHDRRLGEPDQVATELRAEIEPTIAEIYGEGAELEVLDHDDPREPPRIGVRVPAEAGENALEVLGGSQAPGQSPWDISVEKLKTMRDNDEDFVLLDVREENEYEIVNLGGKLAPLVSFGDHLDDLSPSDRIVAHCRAGTRSAKAVAQLRDAGFEDAWNLNGGVMAWIERIDPSLPRY